MARPRITSDDAILAAAIRVIGRHGPVKLTLAAVAKEAGLAPATLVQRFGSKHGLLVALGERNAQRAADPFVAARAGDGSPLAALRATLTQLVAGVTSRAEMANHIAFLQMDVADPELRVHAARHAAVMREEITALLTEAEKAGELGPGTDPPELARAVQVTYNGALVTWALAGDGSLAAALGHDLDRLLAPYRA